MNMLSLFSGCGGMDIGFEGLFTCLKKSVNTKIHPEWIVEDKGDWVTLAPTIFKTVFANDIRPDAKAAWVSYFSTRRKNANNVYHLDSIVDLVKRAKNGDDVFPRDIDIVTGGFPCQDFSIAGKRLGFNSQKSHLGVALESDEPSVESRGQLYMWMREVITITEPKLFIAENVKGLTNLEDVKEVIEHDFADAGNGGYLVVPARVLYAPDYGVPQSRERVIFFGFKKSALTDKAVQALTSEVIPPEFDPYPPKTHGKDGFQALVTVRDALIELDEPEYSADLSQKKYSKAKYMGAHCQGQTEVKMDSVGPTIRSEHHGNIEYRRLSAIHGGKHFDELNAGLPERRLTVRECARIQTFPDDYQFILKKTPENASVSTSDAYKIIGNAVPCILAYNIAKNIEAKWERYFGAKEGESEVEEKEKLIKRITDRVRNAISEMEYVKGDIKGKDFELIVYNAMLEEGIDKDSIIHSAQKFPDFQFEQGNCKIGIEVKKTDSKKWEILGGSIYESLRQQNEDTFVIMGMFGEKPQAMYRRYEECLDDLTVTHSPRFQIKMDIPKGADYLTRNNARDILLLSEGPELDQRIRELLRTDKSTWYSEKTIKPFTELSQAEKDNYFVDGVILFPEVLKGEYSRFAPWMIYKCLVWCASVRDVFSAGGITESNRLMVSGVMRRMLEKSEQIYKRISEMTDNEQEYYWHVSGGGLSTKSGIDKWLTLVDGNIRLSKAVVKRNREKYPQYFDGSKRPSDVIKKKFIEDLREQMDIFNKKTK